MTLVTKKISQFQPETMLTELFKLLVESPTGDGKYISIAELLNLRIYLAPKGNLGATFNSDTIVGLKEGWAYRIEVDDAIDAANNFPYKKGLIYWAGSEFVQLATDAVAFTLTKAAIEAVLTGTITTHTHTLTKAAIEAVLTGAITTHTHTLTKAAIEAILTGAITTHTHALPDNITYKQAICNGQQIAFEASIEPDLNRGQMILLTLTGDCVLENPIHVFPFTTMQILISQDDIGGRIITWGDKYKFPNDIIPPLSTEPYAEDLLTMSCFDGGIMKCVLTKGFHN